MIISTQTLLIINLHVMKTLVLLFAVIFCMSSTSSAQTGACNFTSVTSEYVSSRLSVRFPGKCDVKVNLSWEQDINNGNKWTYVHMWSANLYQAFNFTNPASPPVTADLATTLGTIIVKDPAINPVLYHTYNPDNNYVKVLPLSGYGPLTISKVTIGNIDRFTIENLTLPGLDCDVNGIYDLVATAWSSQSDHGQNVHCNSSGNRFALNKTVNRSLLNCANNSIQPQFFSNTASVQGTYQIFADNVNHGTFDAYADAAITGIINYQTGIIASVAGAWPYKFVASSIVIPSPYTQSNFWMLVKSSDGKSSQVFELLNGCSVLAATLSNFTATRHKNNVTLKWQTLNERNSKGFNVQRKTNGSWTTIGHVATKSERNSSATTSYDFIDVNSFPGVSQYQLVEISIDGKEQSSEVKAVKGEAVLNKILLYPNPSSNGTAMVVFETNSPKDIFIRDMAGRMVKQLRNVTNNNVVIDNLQAGFYTVYIIDQLTKASFSEKLIVDRN